MEILKDYSLKPFNTFGIDAKCKKLIRLQSEADLKEVLKHEAPPFFILGGGSNLLISRDQEHTVLKNEILGIDVVQEDMNRIRIKVGAGENWHEFVLWCLEHGYGGVENLSLIPGTVGASPIQNIGAYGVELEQVFHSLEAINVGDGKQRIFTKEECDFGYRASVFKKSLKGMYFICRVVFELTKKDHDINIQYGAIANHLKAQHINEPSIRDVSNAVIAIRQSKLPDPSQIGNSGSFFKNPIIDVSLFNRIKEGHPQAPHYPISENQVKVPAGWLIEQAGWKGKRIGDAGSYENQALVLVNYGKARGEDILNLAKHIIADVYEKFDIMLSPEVNII